MLALLFGFGTPERVGAQDATVALPKFRKRKAEKIFSKGVELYQKERYKDAAKQFKLAKKSSKTKTDQRLVNGWIRSAQGGIHLAILQRKLDRKLYKEAFFEATDALPNYRNTPIGQKFNEFMDTAAGNAVIVLEDFERPGAGFSKKYGKTYIKVSAKEPGAAFHGRGCIEWAQNEKKTASQMQFKRSIPKNWKQIDGVVLWVYAKSPMPVDVMIRTPSKKKKGVLDYHLQKFKPKFVNRWEKVYLSMAKFKKYGAGDLTNVDTLFFRTPSKGRFNLRVDYVCLVRKAPAAAPRARKR